MDQIFAQLALAGLGHSASFVTKAAFSFATSVAMSKITKLVDSSKLKTNLNFNRIKSKLDKYLQIIEPIIDLVELAVTHGFHSLEPALELINDLNLSLKGISETTELHDLVVRLEDVLLQTIELVPILQLAISASGVTFANKLDKRVSPNLLLQASSFLTLAILPKYCQVGPVFGVKMYSLFESSSRKSNVDWTWKEEYAKSNIIINKETEFEYCLNVNEDFDDGRFHEGETKPRSKRILVTEINRMFYASAGKILKIEDSNVKN
jgi:hypothetical protein